MRTVCIDPGHGGVDPGAIGAKGTPESKVNLSIAWAVVRELHRAEPAIRVVMTRGGHHINPSLRARADIANRSEADAFVSIHCNAAEDPGANGFEVWTHHGKDCSDDLADVLHDVIQRAFPGLRGRMDPSDGDSDKEAGFIILRNSEVPAALVECAFITHPSEETLLNSEEWRRRMGAAIALGILNYLEVL